MFQVCKNKAISCKLVFMLLCIRWICDKPLITYIVLVKHPEDKRGELCRVSVGEELGVDLDEALLGEEAVGAVLEEALVPLLDLLLGDWKKRGLSNVQLCC